MCGGCVWMETAWLSCIKQEECMITHKSDVVSLWQLPKRCHNNFIIIPLEKPNIWHASLLATRIFKRVPWKAMALKDEYNIDLVSVVLNLVMAFLHKTGSWHGTVWSAFSSLVPSTCIRTGVSNSWWHIIIWCITTFFPLH